MITSNIYMRVFRLQYAGQQGTMFAIEVGDRQYLVSAKHILGAASGTFQIDVFHEKNWKPLEVNLIGHSSDSDLTVIAANRLFTPKTLPAKPTNDGIIFGQEVYFLGYPYGLFGDFPYLNNGYPFPFVKRATLSMMDLKSGKAMFLDGINNLGFSGGPVAFKVGNTNEWRIAGVISGYVTTEEVVSHNATDVGLRYAANSGLIKAAPISDAVELIAANPNGFSLA